MSLIPVDPVRPCPNCGSQPGLDSRFFRNEVRLACRCGVSGAWVSDDKGHRGFAWSWADAATGWLVGYPKPERAPCPKE